MEFVSVGCHADASHRLLKIQQDLAGTFLLPRDPLTGNITEFLFYYVKSHWNARYKHLIHFHATLHSKKRERWREQQGSKGSSCSQHNVGFTCCVEQFYLSCVPAEQYCSAQAQAVQDIWEYFLTKSCWWYQPQSAHCFRAWGTNLQ